MMIMLMKVMMMTVNDDDDYIIDTMNVNGICDCDVSLDGA